MRHAAIAELDLTAGRLLDARGHLQRGALAAAGRPSNASISPLAHANIEVRYGFDPAVALGYRLEGNREGNRGHLVLAADPGHPSSMPVPCWLHASQAHTQRRRAQATGLPLVIRVRSNNLDAPIRSGREKRVNHPP